MSRFAPIGAVRSCFREKFGIPRQPGLVPAARATLELLPPYAQPVAVRGLEAFSHLWLWFVFHGIPAGCWQPTVRPPRLGGNRRLGVFATRSTFWPNPIGLSAVKLEHIAVHQGQVVLHLAGADLLDGTPVLDIKPYLSYADRIAEATGGFASEAPALLPAVDFSPAATGFCAAWPWGDAFNSVRPAGIGVRVRPVALATQRTPPWPRLRAAAAHTRSVASSNRPANAGSLAPIVAASPLVPPWANNYNCSSYFCLITYRLSFHSQGCAQRIGAKYPKVDTFELARRWKTRRSLLESAATI